LLLIAHRGNISGPNFDKENHPDYIKEALKQNYQVETDVWFENKKYYLGHDRPLYEVNRHFLSNNKLWCHGKDIPTITELTAHGNLIHCFFHQDDDCTLTSRSWIWTYPGKPVLGPKSIAVMPERFPKWDLTLAGGICSDYIEKYSKK
jgi:hypothetical protein